MTHRTLNAIRRTDGDLDPSSDATVERQVLMLSSVAVSIGATLWAIMYLAAGEPLAASIPIGYTVVTAATAPIALRTNTIGWYRDFQFSLFLILPFLLMLVLGGFVAGSAVIIWSLVAPLGALMSTKPHRAKWWFATYVVAVGASVWLQVVSNTQNSLPEWLRNSLFAMNVLAPTGIAFLLLRRFVHQRDLARDLLRREQERSENLLLNVLPEQVAQRLKVNADSIAEHYDSVSVLFADIVGFTPMSEALSPDAMVGVLNDVFSHFDGLAADFGVEKIRTIGDNYMVAAGLPERRDDHASALADIALAMRDYRADLPDGTSPLMFRIGINSGPAVAGVIGTSRYQYDIWGDTVNTASRMESHGVPGAIQITAATRQMLGGAFECEHRGTIEIKGKAPMETYLLVGRAPTG